MCVFLYFFLCFSSHFNLGGPYIHYISTFVLDYFKGGFMGKHPHSTSALLASQHTVSSFDILMYIFIAAKGMAVTNGLFPNTISGS